jgi:pyruvate dehydrogenase E1 component beta subunit
MLRDPRVFLIGEDIGRHGGAFGVTRTLIDQFGPERVRNTPISENTIVGTGTGAALVGMRPVIEIMFADFSTLAVDQICNQAAKLRFMTGGQCKVPWVLRMPQGGGAGKSIAAQHSQSLEVLYAQFPGLKVVLPSTPYDAKGLIRAAIRDDNPVIFLEHKVLYSLRGRVPDAEYILPIGKCDVKRVGVDVTVIADGSMVWHAMQAAQGLSTKGIDVEVVDVRTLALLDEETIGCRSKDGKGRPGCQPADHMAPRRNGGWWRNRHLTSSRVPLSVRRAPHPILADSLEKEQRLKPRMSSRRFCRGRILTRAATSWPGVHGCR